MVHLHSNIARIRFLYVATGFQRCLFSTQRQGISKERHHQPFIYTHAVIRLFRWVYSYIESARTRWGRCRPLIAAPFDRDL